MLGLALPKALLIIGDCSLSTTASFVLTSPCCRNMHQTTNGLVKNNLSRVQFPSSYLIMGFTVILPEAAPPVHSVS